MATVNGNSGGGGVSGNHLGEDELVSADGWLMSGNDWLMSGNDWLMSGNDWLMSVLTAG